LKRCRTGVLSAREKKPQKGKLTVTEKVGRNAPCPCGSGLKFKNCCMNKERTMPLYQKVLIGLLAVIAAIGAFNMIISFRSLEPGAGPPAGKVWSEEHQHWH